MRRNAAYSKLCGPSPSTPNKNLKNMYFDFWQTLPFFGGGTVFVMAVAGGGDRGGNDKAEAPLRRGGGGGFGNAGGGDCYGTVAADINATATPNKAIACVFLVTRELPESAWFEKQCHNELSFEQALHVAYMLTPGFGLVNMFMLKMMANIVGSHPVRNDVNVLHHLTA